MPKYDDDGGGDGDEQTNRMRMNNWMSERASERERETEQQLRSIKYVINVFQLDI